MKSKPVQYRRRRKKAPMWEKIAPIFLLVLVITGIIALITVATKDLVIELHGKENIVLEFGEDYQEAGATALLNGAEMKDAVVVEGQVSPDRLGSYTVTYTAKYFWRTAKVERTVRVVDTQAPTIVLIYDSNSFTQPGQEYKEEGFVAEDNYDGNITAQVQRIVENDVVIYRVSDSSGNTTEVRRPIKYGDNTPPELQLLGSSSITIDAGTSFKDPGFTAVDNIDGDISGKVKVSGSVDIYIPGTYKIRYSVIDSFGNVAEATRTVVVKGRVQSQTVIPNGKVIYLTFDDGPSSHTVRLLEILKKYNVKATFFVVGNSDCSLLDDIVNQGHAIGIHSTTHRYEEIYASEEAFFKDLNKTSDIIYKYTGKRTKLMRFPGGSSNRVSSFNKGIMTRLTKAVEAQGYKYFDWNVSSEDAAGAKTVDEIFNNVISGIEGRNYSIVLQHDLYGISVDAVEKIIQWGLANGYTFLALDETSPTAHHKVQN